MCIRDRAELIATAVAGGHRALNAMDSLVDVALVEAAHNEGLELNVWTVDDPDRMRELADFGVDGICTNDPALAVATFAT